MSGTNTITGSTTATFAAGAVGTPSIAAHGDTNTGIFFPAADTIAFAEGGVESMRIDSSGNLAVGNTSALVTAANRGNITINGSSSSILVFGVAGVSQGYIFNNGTDLTTLNDNVGAIIWENNGAERMRITSSGNVGIGTSSPTNTLSVTGNANITGNTTLGDATTDTVTVNGYMGVGGAGSSTIGVYQRSTALTGSVQSGIYSETTFSSAATNTGGVITAEPKTAAASFTLANLYGLRTRNVTIGAGSAVTSHHGLYIEDLTGATNNYGITSLVSSGTNKWNIYASGTANNYFAGNVLVGTTTTGGKITALQTSNGNYVGSFQHSNTSPFGVQVYYSNATPPNNTTNRFLDCEDTAGIKAQIRSNGGLANYSANDVNLSDGREKTNFAPAKNYLDTVCSIPVQTFNYVDQNLEDDPGLTLGVVAQDVQEVAPELVMESNWGTEENPKMRLSIYQTDLQYALMKCIQELKAELDTVKAELATLKG